jgi:hypothetical protein
MTYSKGERPFFMVRFGWRVAKIKHLLRRVFGMPKPFDDTFASYLFRTKSYPREEQDRASKENRELLREYSTRILHGLPDGIRGNGRSAPQP